MFIGDGVIRFLPHLLMVAFCAEIPKRHITCTARSYFKGTAASVTCNFRKDMNSDRRTINVVRYPEGTSTDDPGKDVLLCQWQDIGEKYKCELEKGFSIDGNITDHLRLKLPADTGNFTGLYSCFIIHAPETLPNACELTVEEKGGVSTTPTRHGTNFPQEKGESSLLWLIALPVVLIGVLGVVIVYIFRRSSLRNETNDEENVTVVSSEAHLLICPNSIGASPEAGTPCPKGLKDFDLSQGSLEGLMKRFDQEMTASLSEDNGAIDMTCIVPITTLPTESANGAFLVVELTSTTIQVHLVRLHDLKSRKMSKKCDIEAGSLSETHDIPSMTKLGQGRELFDFIATKVNDFVKAHQLLRKKFRLVFVVSSPCVYSPDFFDARLTRWTRGFRCDGVVGRNMKELLQEAFERNEVPNTIRVTTTINDTAGMLMSVAYKDPSCRIALSLMDGFRACYIPVQDNQATSHGDNHTQTNLITTHLGALVENVSNFITECDRRLDQYTFDCGEQSMEKMTSVMYIGEMVRLALLQQMEKGRLFETSPRSLSKLGDKNVVSADDVSLIESDTDTYLITKHVLKKLNVTYTEEDCEAVRLVCKTVTNRAADLAAAGLAMVIHRLNQPEVSVAIETLLHQYHPGFLNRLNERTRELVKPQLQRPDSLGWLPRSGGFSRSMEPVDTSPKFKCPECPAKFTRRFNCTRHVRQKHPENSLHLCHHCGRQFYSKDDFENHLINHRQVPKRTNPHSGNRPATKRRRRDWFAEDPAEMKQTQVEIPSNIQPIYENHWGAIRTHHFDGHLQSMFNFRWPMDQSSPDWRTLLQPVFDRQTKRFKINLSHSFVLYEKENEEYRFFHASQNNARVFDTPRIINTPEDFSSFLSELENTDVLGHARQQRPNSKWTVHTVNQSINEAYIAHIPWVQF